MAPNGQRIAFVSNSTGSQEIGVAKRDRSDQTQFTVFQRVFGDGYAGGSSVPAPGTRCLLSSGGSWSKIKFIVSTGLPP